MIMEHMYLMECRQDRSFILIAQWHLIFDPQTNLKCRVFGARQGLTDRGQNTLKPFVMHICKTCKKQGIMHECNQIGKKSRFWAYLQIHNFRPDLDKRKLSFVWLWTERSCFSPDSGQTNVFLSQCIDQQISHNVWVSPNLTVPKRYLIRGHKKGPKSTTLTLNFSITSP